MLQVDAHLTTSGGMVQPQTRFSDALRVALDLVRQEAEAEADRGLPALESISEELQPSASQTNTEGHDRCVEQRRANASNVILMRIAGNQASEVDGNSIVLQTGGKTGHASQTSSMAPLARKAKTSATHLTSLTVEHGGVVQFIFPLPGSIEGVKSRKQGILRMEKVGVWHSGKDKPTLKDASLTLSSVSRVLVVGGKLAGKTLLAKVLIGEEAPTHGALMRAQGLRTSLLSDLSLHRLEEHMQMTPVDYVLWRFVGYVDQEAIKFQKFADEYKPLSDQAGRRLNASDIVQFFKSFGVDQESAHTPMGQLSNALKVKVCLACCMWQNPHVLLLDEPARFFEAEEFQSLLQSIRVYRGAVLITAHTRDQDMFDCIITEKWFLKDGHFRGARDA